MATGLDYNRKNQSTGTSRGGNRRPADLTDEDILSNEVPPTKDMADAKSVLKGVIERRRARETKEKSDKVKAEARAKNNPKPKPPKPPKPVAGDSLSESERASIEATNEEGSKNVRGQLEQQLSTKSEQLESGKYQELGQLLSEYKNRPKKTPEERKKSRDIVAEQLRLQAEHEGYNTKGEGKFRGTRQVGNVVQGIYSPETEADRRADAEANSPAGRKRKLIAAQAANITQMQADRAANKDKDYNRLQERKKFALDLRTKRYDPASATEEERRQMYERGSQMGLSAKQIDRFANTYLKPQQSYAYQQPQQQQQRAPKQRRSRLDIKPLGTKHRSYSSRGSRYKKAAREASKAGHSRLASDYFGRYLNRKYGAPAIVSQEFRQASGAQEREIMHRRQRRGAAQDYYISRYMR